MKLYPAVYGRLPFFLSYLPAFLSKIGKNADLNPLSKSLSRKAFRAKKPDFKRLSAGTGFTETTPNRTPPSQLHKRLEIGIASWNAPPEKVLIYAGFRGFENEKIFEFSPSVLPIFQSGLGEDTTWRVVRVVEGATLEKSCAARHLGFESLTLRQPEKPVLPASLFYSRFPIPKPASIASAEITFELYSRCA